MGGQERVGQLSPVLVKMLRESSSANRFLSPAGGAAIGLGRLGHNQADLAPYLDSKVPVMRAAACHGLGEMGGEAVNFREQISQLSTQDADASVREAASDALRKIDR